MTSTELELYLQSIVEPDSTEQAVSLPVALRGLDSYVKSDRHLAPRLRHYLERRSYAKALAWVRDPETPHQP